MRRLASREEARSLIIHQREVEGFRDLWPVIKAGMGETKPKRKDKDIIYWRWTFAAVGTVVVFLAGFFLITTLFQNGPLLDQDGETNFQINSIRVGNEPATPFLFQPKDSDMIFVWAEKGM
jgi:hypothetical protein